MDISTAGFVHATGKWTGKLSVTMRQTCTPGEKMFVYYAGQTLPINALTGEVRQRNSLVPFSVRSYTMRKASGRSAWPLLLSVLPLSLTSKGGSTVRMHYLLLLPQKKVCYFNDCYW